MTNPLNQFHPKAVQGLYSFNHYERADGAWFQRSIDPTRRTITYCASPTTKFQTFPDLAAFRAHLESIA